jgi:hypothetical protein
VHFMIFKNSSMVAVKGLNESLLRVSSLLFRKRVSGIS